MVDRTDWIRRLEFQWPSPATTRLGNARKRGVPSSVGKSNHTITISTMKARLSVRIWRLLIHVLMVPQECYLLQCSHDKTSGKLLQISTYLGDDLQKYLGNTVNLSNLKQREICCRRMKTLAKFVDGLSSSKEMEMVGIEIFF
ncbi:hypothetical protein AVEN_266279-1 [Araneus ventricosus]|uniref:Uncharacterized protein n=1 Tax=Araneus ventricosus TaxID=182803 RepID=A0A4Y2RTA7_ARAVE|nr:hypothetical protein AVEN_266279-1 [Araneus ventricosus]